MVKIIIAAKKHDSINSISKRIGVSYGWTYKWVKELAGRGVFSGSKMELRLMEDSSFYRYTLTYIKKNFSKDINFYYTVLKLFGVKYCFTKTDAVFTWTKGGYNIGRYKDYYPIFIKLKRDQLNVFKWYCKKLDLKINAKKGIFYSIETVNKNFEPSYSGDIPVESLDWTIKFMDRYVYNFQPALEMVNEMYGKKIKIRYRETNYV